jgi:predicted Ser/Thr protein kinase
MEVYQSTLALLFPFSGGSGAVFSFNVEQPNQLMHIDNQVVIKVSWKASRSTVHNECNILQILESNNVPHVERCLSRLPYDEGRIMIAMQPVVMDRTSSLANLSSHAQEKAIQQVVETTIGMLLANVITVDVQLLVSDTGDVLFIDFTEAKQLSSPPSAGDLNSLVGFCNEILALMPEDCKGKAMVLFQKTLKDMKTQGFVLEDEVYNIVDSIFLGAS